MKYRYIPNEPVFIIQPPRGPLAAYVQPFCAWAFDQGYERHSVRRRVALAADFSQWLQRKDVSVTEVSSEHPAEYLRHLWRQRPIHGGDSPSLKQFMEFLRHQGIIAVDQPNPEPTTPVEQCLREFETYLQDQRGLAVTTVSQYTLYVRLFLRKCFGDDPIVLTDLRADDVTGFIQQESSPTHFVRPKAIAISLRSFFRFAHYRGAITADLAASVPKVASWSMSGIPRAISEDQTRKLLSSIERGHGKGLRNYAILLLLARLGLRSGEIASLEIEDIDWISGSLKVRGKGREALYPLPQDVGEAIVAYLRHGRPPSTSRRLFLRCMAPFRGFRGSPAIGGIVHYAIKRAGVEAPTRGSHQFRHGLASQMLHHGSSLKEIGELLGHRSIEVTKIYAKVDIDALRKLALSWPGGVQ
ncbi:MAG: site-specific integrase [Acidobacteriia bacterium]|nr:site-specific integrase [Terriglobia bacterium]